GGRAATRPVRSRPWLAGMPSRPVPGREKSVGSDPAGTRKYMAVTINRTAPRMVTMPFMLEPPLPADHSKAAPSLSSPVWLFEFNGSDVMRRVFSHDGLPWPPQYEPCSTNRISLGRAPTEFRIPAHGRRIPY